MTRQYNQERRSRFADAISLSKRSLEVAETTDGVPSLDSISEELVAEERSIDYYDHKIGNYLNAQYYGSLFIGSDSREHEFIFDTGSPWLWISCVPCN